MTEQIEPATDKEIASTTWNCDCSTKGPTHPRVCMMIFGRAVEARIDADQGRIREVEIQNDTNMREIYALKALNAEMLEALKGLYHSPASFTDERMDYDERQVSKADYATAGAVVAKAEKGIA